METRIGSPLDKEIEIKLKEIDNVQAILSKKEGDLEDQINDIFDEIASVLEQRRKEVIAQLRSRIDSKCQRLGIIPILYRSFIRFISFSLCYLENQSEELKNRLNEERVTDIILAETPHVSVCWPGLDEVKSLTNGLGEVTSSSCIPSVSTVGQWQYLN